MRYAYSVKGIQVMRDVVALDIYFARIYINMHNFNKISKLHVMRHMKQQHKNAQIM